MSGDAEGGAELVAAMLCNLSSDILDDLAKSSAWNLSLDESEGGGMGMGKSLGTSLGLDDGDLGIFDADNVATGAAISEPKDLCQGCVRLTVTGNVTGKGSPFCSPCITRFSSP